MRSLLRSSLLCSALMLGSWLTWVAFSQPSPGTVVNISPSIADGDVVVFCDTSGIFVSNAPSGSIAGGLEGVLQWSSNTSLGVLFSNEVRITGRAGGYHSRLVLGHDSPIWMIGPNNVISNVMAIGGSDFDIAAAALDHHELDIENRRWGTSAGKLMLDVENGALWFTDFKHLDMTLGYFYSAAGDKSINYILRQKFDGGGNKIEDWGVGVKWDSGGDLSISSQDHKLYGGGDGSVTIDYGTRTLWAGSVGAPVAVFEWHGVAMAAHRDLDMKGFSVINNGPGSLGLMLEASPGITNSFSVGVTNFDLVTGAAHTQLVFGIGTENYGVLSTRDTNGWDVSAGGGGGGGANPDDTNYWGVLRYGSNDFQTLTKNVTNDCIYSLEAVDFGNMCDPATGHITTRKSGWWEVHASYMLVHSISANQRGIFGVLTNNNEWVSHYVAAISTAGQEIGLWQVHDRAYLPSGTVVRCTFYHTSSADRLGGGDIDHAATYVHNVSKFTMDFIQE